MVEILGVEIKVELGFERAGFHEVFELKQLGGVLAFIFDQRDLSSLSH